MYKPRTIFWGALILDAFTYIREQDLNMSDFQVLFYLM